MLENLFEPYTLREKTIKNRLAVAPMVTNYCAEDGKATEKFLSYYEKRAEGGFGLIITEAFAVDPLSRAFTNMGCFWSDDHIKGHDQLPVRVHKHGSKVIMQIVHCGRQLSEVAIGAQPVAPSAIHCPFSPNDTPRPLSVEEIHQLVEQFGDAALRAKKCGFDGVEIHGAHGYLIAQFMSPYTNKRLDEYGGNLQNRMKFPLEIIKNVRQKCGEDFIVGFRMSIDEFVDGGRTIADSKSIAVMIQDAGVDIIHASAGVYASVDAVIPPFYVKNAWLTNLTRELKTVCRIPVITVGRINDPIIADNLIKSGVADFVSIGRGSLADPAFPNKAKAHQLEDITQCIACNVGCLGLLFSDNEVRCVVNPRCGLESTHKSEKTTTPKKIAIVGAGPAGMQAAIELARLGHKVNVYEKDSIAGGQLKTAAVPPFKSEIITFLNWQRVQAQKLGIGLHYNTEINVNSFHKDDVDEIIIATGAKPIIPDIPGVNLDHVVSAQDLLAGKVSSGQNPVVIGGGQIGAEVANHLAVQMTNVTIIEQLGEIAADEQITAKWHLLRSLEKHKVTMLTNTTATVIGKDYVKARDSKGEIITITADLVVIATGMESENKLETLFTKAGFITHSIGDAKEINKILGATSQAYALAQNI